MATNLIPDMTGYTTPSGEASASSEYNTVQYPAWKCMDRDTSSFWATPSGTTSGWIQYEFDTAEQCNEYSIQALPASTFAPNTWTLQASSTGAFSGEEVTLDTQTNIVFGYAEKKSFTFSNSTSYTHYRIDITSNNGGGYIAVAEIEFSEADPTAVSDGSIEIGGNVEAVGYPISNASITVGMEYDGYIFAESTALLSVTGISNVYVSPSISDMFTIAYSIQQALSETKFKIIYSIEQPKTATIIKRVSS